MKKYQKIIYFLFGRTFEDKIISGVMIIAIACSIAVAFYLNPLEISPKPFVKGLIFYIFLRIAWLLNNFLYLPFGKYVNLDTHVSDEKKALEDIIKKLEEIDSHSFGFFRVMTPMEKITHTLSVGLFLSGLYGAVYHWIVYNPIKGVNYGNIVDWLSITALGLAIRQMSQATAKERLSKKIRFYESKLNDLLLRQERNILNKILSKVEKIK